MKARQLVDALSVLQVKWHLIRGIRSKEDNKQEAK